MLDQTLSFANLILLFIFLGRSGQMLLRARPIFIKFVYINCSAYIRSFLFFNCQPGPDLFTIFCFFPSWLYLVVTSLWLRQTQILNIRPQNNHVGYTRSLIVRDPLRGLELLGISSEEIFFSSMCLCGLLSAHEWRQLSFQAQPFWCESIKHT